MALKCFKTSRVFLIYLEFFSCCLSKISNISGTQGYSWKLNFPYEDVIHYFFPPSFLPFAVIEKDKNNKNVWLLRKLIMKINNTGYRFCFNWLSCFNLRYLENIFVIFSFWYCLAPIPKIKQNVILSKMLPQIFRYSG